MAFYEQLDRFGFGYVIRFRGVVHVESADDEVRKAKEWVLERGRPKLLRQAKVTHARFCGGAVVCVHQKGMKEAWHLAASSDKATATELVKTYGRRFTCEQTHRDIKDLRFGMGLSAIPIGACDRRDRLLLLSAFAMALLTLLGAAGEATGIDRYSAGMPSSRRRLASCESNEGTTQVRDSTQRGALHHTDSIKLRRIVSSSVRGRRPDGA